MPSSFAVNLLIDMCAPDHAPEVVGMIPISTHMAIIVLPEALGVPAFRWRAAEPEAPS